MVGSLNNILVYQSGGRLVLDEPFRGQPSAASITIQTLDGENLAELGGGFTSIIDVAADVSTLSLTLPATTFHQRVIAPSATTGFDADIDALTDPGYVLLVNRGGRLAYATPSEYEVVADDVTSFRLDDGLDFVLTAGDTAKGIRVQYDVDWSVVTSKFVGQVLATWKVTVGSKVQTIKRVYDLVRQVLHCPATWQNVKARRADIDAQTTNVPNKEEAVQQAWEDVCEELRRREIYYNLVIPHGSTALRDSVVYRCLLNLCEGQTLNAPPQYIGGLDEYMRHLEMQRGAAMGALSLYVDKNEDGNITQDEAAPTRRIWLRGRSRTPPQINKVVP